EVVKIEPVAREISDGRRPHLCLGTVVLMRNILRRLLRGALDTPGGSSTTSANANGQVARMEKLVHRVVAAAFQDHAIHRPRGRQNHQGIDGDAMGFMDSEAVLTT